MSVMLAEEKRIRDKAQRLAKVAYESGLYNLSALSKRAGMNLTEFHRVRNSGAGGLSKLEKLIEALDEAMGSKDSLPPVQETPRTYPEFEVSDALAETYTILRGLVSMLGDTRGTMRQRIDMLEANLGVLLQLVPDLRAQAEKENSEKGSPPLQE